MRGVHAVLFPGPSSAFDAQEEPISFIWIAYINSLSDAHLVQELILSDGPKASSTCREEGGKNHTNYTGAETLVASFPGPSQILSCSCGEERL